MEKHGDLEKTIEHYQKLYDSASKKKSDAWKDLASKYYKILSYLLELQMLRKKREEEFREYELFLIKKDVKIRDLERKLAKYEVPGIER